MSKSFITLARGLRASEASPENDHPAARDIIYIFFGFANVIPFGVSHYEIDLPASREDGFANVS